MKTEKLPENGGRYNNVFRIERFKKKEVTEKDKLLVTSIFYFHFHKVFHLDFNPFPNNKFQTLPN